MRRSNVAVLAAMLLTASTAGVAAQDTVRVQGDLSAP